MKKMLAMLLALAMVLSMAACAQTQTDAPSAESPDVPMQYMTADELAAALGSDGYMVLDVRKAADYETSHIIGSVSADMDAAKNGDAEAGEATMTAATEGVDDTLVLICYSGKSYAQATTNALSAIGYDMSKVYTLEGGFNNWSEVYPDKVEAGAEASVEDEEAESKVLSADELEAMMAEQSIKIFDLRSAEDFEAGHIPGAININNKEFEDPTNPVDGEIATVEQFEALMSSYGVSSDDVIVTYAKAEKPQMAARLIWTLEVYGHTNTYLLDGHYQAWESAGKAIETGANPEFEAAEYKVQSVNSDINVNKDYVINRSEDAVVLDARPATDYVGETVADGNARGGHIPGAVNVFYMDTVDENGLFLDVDALSKLYGDVGATPDKEIIVYCQRGHRASHTWFVLAHILGYENVKVYDGSMMEWSNLEELPIVAGLEDDAANTGVDGSSENAGSNSTCE